MLSFAKIVAFVPTRNSGKARKFYEETLGLRLVSEDQFATVLDSNGVILRVVTTPPFTPHPFTILGWEVAAIEDEITALLTKGLTFERFPGLPQDELGIWTAPSGDKVAWFKDPDGNVLSLSQHG